MKWPNISNEKVNIKWRDFPTFEYIPEAYLMVAQLLSEHLGDDDRAVKILQFIIKNYASHPLAKEVETYLATVQRIASQP
jgi:TolA-binding protein